MNDFRKLADIASKQGGFFTATQAEACGYVRTNHSYHMKVGNWEREGWGLYRLPFIPRNEITSYWSLYLWTRDKNDIPQAVISHETALSLYEISDVNPTQIHFTVSKKFRKTTRKPKVLILHKKNINFKEVTDFHGMKITTPIQTLNDLHEEKSLSIELMEQATKEALKKGLISKAELKNSPQLLEYTL